MNPSDLPEDQIAPAKPKPNREDYFRALRGIPAGTLASLPPMISIPSIPRKAPPAIEAAITPKAIDLESGVD